MLTAATTAIGVGMNTGAAHADDAVWDRVAACEAGGNWHINTGNGFYGGLQFTVQSWNGAGGSAYASRPDLATREQQIAVGRKLLALQGPGAWPSCSIKAGLTRDNGGVGAPAPAPVPGGGNSGGGGNTGGGTKAATPTPTPSETATPKPAPKPAPPAPGRSDTQGTAAIQTWIGGNLSGKWDEAAIKALQAKLHSPITGKMDKATVKATEAFLKITPTGVDYFSQAVLDKLSDYARKKNSEATLTSLAAAVEGGFVSPGTVQLATNPVTYR
ncbi:hypothetical protein KEM60_00006 [Austwickia sp. TVS 96-490-7B]|nr:hypothetical protein [Austwickia sp. TVS 96-490-7B]